MCEWVLGGLLGGLVECASWAALYNTWLLIDLTSKAVTFFLPFFLFPAGFVLQVVQSLSQLLAALS